MAVLNIEAEASDGVRPPTPILAIDGWVIHLIKGKAQVEVTGSCGDGSRHRLSYDIRGPEGETLKVAVACGDTTVRELEIEIYSGFIVNSGVAEFRL